jgi:phage baseplate assembly protein V
MSGVETIRREIQRAMAGSRQAFRGVLQSLKPTTRVQRAQVAGLAGEVVPDAELMQHFGFTSRVPSGAQLVVLPVGGKTSQSVVVATEHGSFRIALAADGETCIYSQWGDRVYLKADRSILVQAAAKVEVQAPLATFSGNVQIAGNLQVQGNFGVVGTSTGTGAANFTGGVTGAGVVLQSHTHSGVQSGGNNTGGPT